MSADRLIASYLRVAKEDLDGARVLAKAGNRNAIYLCEQAAEKVIRAVLTSESQHAGIKHHLGEMVDLIPDSNPIKPMLRAIEHLAAYATSFRYPTDAGRIKAPPSPTTLTSDLAAVERALGETSGRFGVDLAAADGPATTPTPIR